ncbi:MAG: nuclear transport factor 2 family protein [Gemmatimonadales bacterium]
MDNIALVETILDQAREAEDFQPLFDHLAEDMSFEVMLPDGAHESWTGKQAVINYLGRLGMIVPFWRVEILGNGDRVIVFGEEAFDIQHWEVSARSEFALMLHLRFGMITRLLIVEDLSAVSRGDLDGTLADLIPAG